MLEVEVTATRATRNTPVAYSDIQREAIARNSYGFDIPSLIALTPSVVATNETGIGIGGTAIRLRGTDATRINVTINGVSMNNPDSHSMYWYRHPRPDFVGGHRAGLRRRGHLDQRHGGVRRRDHDVNQTPCKPNSRRRIALLRFVQHQQAGRCTSRRACWAATGPSTHG
ncbi:MAG: TonB-dependent receptor plug domain-containing protein [Alistipes shahii]|uniref:TonB-dependent receptor plug domain-containing protein n=1 Tax=Alistipes shahii TaxID=328814 RepID=UPI00399C7A5E